MRKQDQLIELENLFHRETVLTMEMIKKTLESSSKATIFRKLKMLGHIASYSDAGKYHTLGVLAKYNKYGLWSFEGIHFSRYGTLITTLEIIINRSSEGYFAKELQSLLQVRVFNALTQLVLLGRVDREQISEEYLYISTTTGSDQLARRKETIMRSVSHEKTKSIPGFISEEIIESLQAFLSILNERQARVYLGLESMKIGHGGDIKISQLTGINVKTIAKGRIELLKKDITPERIRKAGAGRPSIKKKQKL